MQEKHSLTGATGSFDLNVVWWMVQELQREHGLADTTGIADSAGNAKDT